ncbi:MAG TPA: hypothetical protein VNN25_21890 [Thermoanaerobaculia bacterium]|nr:hypothetical protein [Thermoanaerobaculia bacterium]
MADEQQPTLFGLPVHFTEKLPPMGGIQFVPADPDAYVVLSIECKTCGWGGTFLAENAPKVCPRCVAELN